MFKKLGQCGEDLDTGGPIGKPVRAERPRKARLRTLTPPFVAEFDVACPRNMLCWSCSAVYLSRR